MNKFLLSLFLLLTVASVAAAENIQLDETFKKTSEWLKKENLTVTGGPNGSRDDNAAFMQEAILFYGEAVGNPAHTTPAQREMMAKRAAVVTAQRAVAEYLEGFALVGDTLLKDGMTQSDVIRSSVAGFVRGAQVVFQEYSKEKDVAVALVKIGLNGPKGIGAAIYSKLDTDPGLKKVVATDKPAFVPEPAKAEPAPEKEAEPQKEAEPAKKAEEPAKVDDDYDGLVIDASEQNFRPALINRIFTAKGEVIYDPAKVNQKVLVEQGCGEYTNSIDKAKAALAARGVQKPLVIKAASAVTVADLQVSDEDAVRVFSSSQKSGYLAAAKVAFVLK